MRLLINIYTHSIIPITILRHSPSVYSFLGGGEWSHLEYTQSLDNEGIFVTRMRINITLLLLVSLHMYLAPGILYGQALYGSGTPATTALLAIDFSMLSETARKDLVNFGFTFEKQMKDENKIHLTAKNGGLKLSTSGQAFGFMVKKELHINRPNLLEIEWGVEAYPPGADWRYGKNYEPLMVVLFFGDPLPSNHLFLPDTPLFIGMFLGKNEPPLLPYSSKNYSNTGRYVCLGNPEPGQMITSRIDIAKVFHLWFGGQEMPPVTAIAIEVDTGEVPLGENSSAFIKSISLGRAD